MSTTRTWRWGQIVLTVLILTALVIFRGSLWQWFSVGSLEDSTQLNPRHNLAAGSANDPGEEAQPGIPLHRFSEDEVAELGAVFAATEEVRIALSQDRVDSVSVAVTEIRTGLGRLDFTQQPPDIRAALAEAEASIGNLEVADTAVVARKPFASLLQALFSLAEADSRLREGWHAFSCPMTDDFPKWFQEHNEIENPYMGQQMLACGSASDWSSHEAQSSTLSAADDVAHYTCPMHVSVRQPAPGPCPICAMDLAPVSHQELRTGDVLLESGRRQRIGVRTETVTRRAMTRQIRAVAELAWDESRVQDITARVDGWVEGLQVSRVGDPVEADATLLRFYSPDLLATQRELLAAPPGGRLAEAASERLRLWGMSSGAIRAITRSRQPMHRISIHSPITGVVIDKRVNEGSHVSAGALLYRVVDPSKIWVLAEIFEQDLPHITLGQQVQVTLPIATAEPLVGEVAYIYPTVSSESRTAKVRVELDNPDGVLRPGMFASLGFEVELGDHLAVPTDAVIYTGPRRLVFVDKGEGRLRPVEVQIGVRTEDWIIITDGLTEGDEVVSSGVFLLASESRIFSATGHWEANDEAQ